MQNETNYVYSIGRWSQLQGKRTGIVTTTRVTHASPAGRILTLNWNILIIYYYFLGVYAHTAHRDWESDTDVVKAGFSTSDCADIATQLIHGETGRNLNVILGGGRGEFIPKSQKDEEGETGLRSDDQNLIEQWKEQKAGTNHRYVFDRHGLLSVPDNTDYLLGLFEKDHTKYNLDRDPIQKPSLAEMTEAAIKVLSRDDKGYFLFVEGGRIDHAHHETMAQRALNETLELHKAVQLAVDITDPDNTLIVVTSDHAHTMSFSGYPLRGNDILGSAGMGEDNMPYSTLSYANGPGYKKEEEGMRHDISRDDMRKYYTYK